MQEVSINVNGMTCGHCAQTVSGAVSTVSGVNAVEVDVVAGTVVVSGTDVDHDAIHVAIVDAGYSVTER